MAIPDRLEQVLAKLEALELVEQTIGTEHARNFDVRFGDVLLVNHRFLLAKLRAALEMEKALTEAPVPGTFAWMTWYEGQRQKALAAWQQAGEESCICEGPPFQPCGPHCKYPYIDGSALP